MSEMMSTLAAVNYAMAPAGSKYRKMVDADRAKAEKAAARRAQRNSPEGRAKALDKKIAEADARIRWEQDQATKSPQHATFHLAKADEWDEYRATLQTMRSAIKI